MELLETQDPEKKKLIESSDRHKRALEKELSEMTQKTDRMLTNALIIGGSLALTYFVISSLSRKRRKKKNKIVTAAAPKEGDLTVATTEDDSPSVLGEVGDKIMNQISFLVLDIAKDKLMEYLKKSKKTDDHS